MNIVDDEALDKRTLEISFIEDFQQLQHDQQLSELKSYIQRLYQNAQTLNKGQADRQGVLMIMQICEELLPHIQQQDIDLNETIELEMSPGGGTSEVSVSLSDFGVHQACLSITVY